MIIEPHTALEDARDFELPILLNILKKRDWQDNIKPYDWKDFQAKNSNKFIVISSLKIFPGKIIIL